MTKHVAVLSLVLVGVLTSASSVVARTEKVTLAEHVASIFHASCTTCHRPGQVGPMSLLTYEDARPWARSIKQKVQAREMPPWHADPAVGTWAKDRSLTDQEISTIVAWVDGGALRGNLADIPALPDYADTRRTIGTADAIFAIPPFVVPEEGQVDYTYFEVPTNLAEDRWIEAVEVRPGVPRVVHHVIVSARTDERRKAPGVLRLDREILPGEEIDWNPGVAQLEGRGKGDPLGGTTVGNDGVSVFEPGTARLLKAGTTLVFEMHYTPTGESVVDQTELGLKFTDTPPERIVWNGVIVHGQFVIPPGDPDYTVEADVSFAEDVQVLSVLPHSHLRGTRWDYQAVYPDGRRQTMLSVPKYDFNWQIDYMFDEPLKLPGGSRIEAVAHYDNSEANRSNPDPTAEVRWGEQTDEEMMFTSFAYLVDGGTAGSDTIQQPEQGPAVTLGVAPSSEAQAPQVRVVRRLDGPIIGPELDPSIGENIQGPSMIRVPDWVDDRLGDYYLYFADHKGLYIRLAYADDVLGPWRVHVPGSLQIASSHSLTEPPEVSPEELEQHRAARARRGAPMSHDLLTEVTTPHIASPDVHVDDETRRIVMYFHGLDGVGRQVTRVATSTDGIRFEARPEVLGRTYMRVFTYDGDTYAMSMPGQFYRSRDPLGGFEEGPRLFDDNMRHAAMLVRGDTLFVFWTQVGHVPERILLSTIDISGDWSRWSDTSPVELLRPEYDWEGADAPLEPSVRSTAYGHVNQLRDPAIFEANGRVFLLYAVAGESGIAIAEVHLD